MLGPEITILKFSHPQILKFLNSGVSNESASVSQTDLRQVQDRPPPRRGAGDLPESET